MKLALYTKAGTACFGAVVGDGIMTLNGRLGRDTDSLGALLAADAQARAAAIVAASTPDAQLADVTLLPLLNRRCQDPVCGLNYQSHADEIGRAVPKPDVGFFVKLPSALVAHGAALRMPHVSDHFDFEGEICVVIGTGGVTFPKARR